MGAVNDGESVNTRAGMWDQWDTGLSVQAALERVQRLAYEWEFETVFRTDHEVILQQGSQVKTRFIGGWFADPKRFPKKTRVRVTPATGVSRVEVAVFETLGFGFLDPHFKRRYEEYFASWIEAMRLALPPVASRGGSSTLDLLETLAKLREKGILTQQEFESRKRRVLAN